MQMASSQLLRLTKPSLIDESFLDRQSLNVNDSEVNGVVRLIISGKKNHREYKVDTWVQRKSFRYFVNSVVTDYFSILWTKKHQNASQTELMIMSGIALSILVRSSIFSGKPSIYHRI